MAGNRRAALIASAIVIMMLLSWGSSFASEQGSTTKTPIKHLVILMMENHSFDNLFGIYGIGTNDTVMKNVTIPLNLLSANPSASLSAVKSGSFTTSNPNEGHANYLEDWNHGLMNNFINGSGPSSMTYFTSSQMGPEWMLAQQYALGDMYFSEMLSETLPNRLYSLSGFSPINSDQGSPPPYLLYNDTIFNEMDAFGVSWAYDFFNPSLGTDPLQFIYGINQHSSGIGTWGNFVNAVNSGTLPDVTWISSISGGTLDAFSQHPPFSVLVGEMWILYIVHLIMESSYWNSTAIMITYDEGGGYYDQAPPPIVDGQQLGFRVPFILISPYAKEDYVSHTIMTHTSILGFIDYNWNMPALNSLVLNSNIPVDMFNFNDSYRSGTAARPPLFWNSSQLALIPNSFVDSSLNAGNYTNVSNFFPTDLQYPLGVLPYGSNGSTGFNLSQVSLNVYVKHETGFFPAQQNTYFPVQDILIIAAVGISVPLIFLIIKRKRNKL